MVEDITDEEFDINEPLGIITYLSLIKKYPNARVDLLELRRQKNKASLGVMAIVAVIFLVLGYFIRMWIEVF